MLNLQDVLDKKDDLKTIPDVIDYGTLTLAAVAEHLSHQDSKTKRDCNTLKKAAAVLSIFKTSLQFAPMPLFGGKEN